MKYPQAKPATTSIQKVFKKNLKVKKSLGKEFSVSGLSVLSLTLCHMRTFSLKIWLQFLATFFKVSPYSIILFSINFHFWLVMVIKAKQLDFKYILTVALVYYSALNRCLFETKLNLLLGLYYLYFALLEVYIGVKIVL